MLSIGLQARIFTDYHAGADHTRGTKYIYTLQYNPLSCVHTWIIRKPKSGGAWDFVQPLALDMQFAPRNSCRRGALIIA